MFANKTITVLIFFQLVYLQNSLILLSKQLSKYDKLYDLEIREIVNSEVYLHEIGKSQSFYVTNSEYDESFNVWDLPLQNIQCILTNLVHDYDTFMFLDRIDELNQCHESFCWDIDFTFINRATSLSIKNETLNSKLFLCAVSQLIQGKPNFLSDKENTYSYSIIESKSGFYFGRKHRNMTQRQGKIKFRVDDIITNWARRPFSFSSASNLEITESVCNILCEKVMKTLKTSLSDITLLDCCCGSGTMIYSGLR